MVTETEARCPVLLSMRVHGDTIQKGPCPHKVTGQEPHTQAGTEVGLPCQEREERQISSVSYVSRLSTQEAITLHLREGLLLRVKLEYTYQAYRTGGPEQQEEKEDAIQGDLLLLLDLQKRKCNKGLCS